MKQLKIYIFLAATASISQQKGVLRSPYSQTNFENCSDNVALVFMIGPSKVTRNAPDVLLNLIIIYGRVTHIYD